MPVHYIARARASDPEVVSCEECKNIVTVVQPGEVPRCARCGQPLCADCRERFARGGSAVNVAPPLSSDETTVSSASIKDQEFARGVLKTAGLSEEYAAIVAERITRPGADLSKSDQEYLALVKRQHATTGPWIKTPWSKSN